MSNYVPFGGNLITPPGTTTVVGYSNTPVGKLLGGINGSIVAGTAGVINFDGAGHIFATASSSSTASQSVGSYTVNQDCTINVTLTDTFYTATSPGSGVPTQGSASLIGSIISGGAEIDLGWIPTSSTGTNPPQVPGQYTSRAFVQLVRSYQYFCAVGNLNGVFGLVGNGYVILGGGTSGGTTQAPFTQPTTSLARLHFDGNGNVVADQVSSSSPLGTLQYTGTYTVGADCSGTATLNAQTSGSTSTTSGGTATLSFVLTQPNIVVNPNTNPGSYPLHPAMQFTLAVQTVAGTGSQSITGYGRQQ